MAEQEISTVKNTEIAHQQSHGASVSPVMQMLSHAVTSGQSIEVVRELMAMSKELAADEARRAFDAAVADAKAEISAQTIFKNASGHNNKRYADFSAYAKVVDPVLGKFGLSYRFRTVQADRIKVSCILSHKAGHSEENSLEGPADTTGNKNAIQSVGSTLTYLQRYTLIQALGLAATNDDDGGKSGQRIDDLINVEQVETLLGLIDKTDTDIEKFCETFKIGALTEMRVIDFDGATRALNIKLTRKLSPENSK